MMQILIHFFLNMKLGLFDKFNLVLAARALDVTVSAQKSASRAREYQKA